MDELKFWTADHCGCQCHVIVDDAGNIKEHRSYNEARAFHEAKIDEQLNELKTARPDVRVSGANRYATLRAWYAALWAEFNRRKQALDEGWVWDEETYQTELHKIAGNTVYLLHISPDPLPAPKMCPAHKALGDTSAKFNAVVEENQRKNFMFKEIHAILPNVTQDNYRPTFNASRELEVEIVGITITPAQRGQIQAAANARFGVGKVRVK